MHDDVDQILFQQQFGIDGKFFIVVAFRDKSRGPLADRVHGLLVRRHPAGENVFPVQMQRLPDQDHRQVVLRMDVTVLLQFMISPERDRDRFLFLLSVHHQKTAQFPAHHRIQRDHSVRILGKVDQAVRMEQEHGVVREMVFHIVFGRVDRSPHHAQRQVAAVFRIELFDLARLRIHAGDVQVARILVAQIIFPEVEIGDHRAHIHDVLQMGAEEIIDLRSDPVGPRCFSLVHQDELFQERLHCGHRQRRMGAVAGYVAEDEQRPAVVQRHPFEQVAAYARIRLIQTAEFVIVAEMHPRRQHGQLQLTGQKFVAFDLHLELGQ